MAGLPNADRAFIAPEKITKYLLSRTHPRGQDKAAFFESFGFTLLAWEDLRDALLKHAVRGAMIATETTMYGEVYEVNGRLESPDRRNPFAKVVWMVRVAEDFPRLVTAVPSEEPS